MLRMRFYLVRSQLNSGVRSTSMGAAEQAYRLRGKELAIAQLCSERNTGGNLDHRSH